MGQAKAKAKANAQRGRETRDAGWEVGGRAGWHRANEPHFEVHLTLLFYFNLHRVVQSPFSMNDMFSSYRAACGGVPCDETDVRFGELANGVRQVFQPTPGKVQDFLDAATLFGVATP